MQAPVHEFDAILPDDDAAHRVNPTSRLWYRASLIEAPIAVHHITIIGQHFADAVAAVDWPAGACLFLSGDALYFSPAAIAAVPHLIVACEARPSGPPSRDNATLVAGREADWALLPYEHH
jgi:hypothetical protein